MSLQLYPAPPFLSNTPFYVQHNTFTPLDFAVAVQEEQISASLTSGMDSRPQSLNLEGRNLSSTTINHNSSSSSNSSSSNSNNTSPGPSPGIQSASVIMSASPYSNPPAAASSNQTSETALERESKRPRVVRSDPGSFSGTSRDMSDQMEHHSINGAHEHLVTFPQTASMVNQSSSSLAVVAASSTMPSDTYPAAGTAYWDGNPLGTTDIMDKSVSDDGAANTGMGGPMPGGTQSQLYGGGMATWAGQDMPMPMNPMAQYLTRQLNNSPWEPELPHHPHHQHSSQQQQQQQQHMLPDGSLASPYEPASVPASSANPHIYGDSSFVNNPGQQQQHHRIVPPPNPYEPPPPPPAGLSAPTTPHHAPAWPHAAFPGLPPDLQPRILPSSRSSSSSGPPAPALAPRRSPARRTASPPPPATTTTKSKTTNGTAVAAAATAERTTHNDVERKYRTNLKDRIAELRAAVPALQAPPPGGAPSGDGESDDPAVAAAAGGAAGGAAAPPKVSKGTVLSKATEYIQQLERANRIMMTEHQQLVGRLRTLEAMLHGGARPPPPHPPPPPPPPPSLPPHSQQPYSSASNHMHMFDPRGFN